MLAIVLEGGSCAACRTLGPRPERTIQMLSAGKRLTWVQVRGYGSPRSSETS